MGAVTGIGGGHHALYMGAVTTVTANQRLPPPTPPSLTTLYRRALYMGDPSIHVCIDGSPVTQPMGGLFLGPWIPYLPDTVMYVFFYPQADWHLQKKKKRRLSLPLFGRRKTFTLVILGTLGISPRRALRRPRRLPFVVSIVVPFVVVVVVLIVGPFVVPFVVVVLSPFIVVPVVVVPFVLVLIFSLFSRGGETGFVGIVTGIIYIFDSQSIQFSRALCQCLAVNQETTVCHVAKYIHILSSFG